MNYVSRLVLMLLSVVGVMLAQPAHAARIKDIAALSAARPNQLIGYGLVVGLQGSGDGKDISFTIQSLRDTLSRLGASVDGPLSSYDLDPTAVKDFKVENVAAVMVTAELPAFAKPGQKIDVNVAAIAKAKSLRGGVLLMTTGARIRNSSSFVPAGMEIWSGRVMRVSLDCNPTVNPPAGAG